MNPIQWEIFHISEAERTRGRRRLGMYTTHGRSISRESSTDEGAIENKNVEIFLEVEVSPRGWERNMIWDVYNSWKYSFF